MENNDNTKHSIKFGIYDDLNDVCEQIKDFSEHHQICHTDE